MPRIETGIYTFTVKEGESSRSGADDAPVWIELEPETAGLTLLAHGTLRLSLTPDTTMEQARDLAKLLRRHVADLRFQQG